MNQSGTPDSELLERLRAGQPEAFRQLVESRKHKVLNICYRFVHSREDAEDIAQETFVEAHRSIEQLREASLIEPWIYRIAVSKSLNFVRQKRRLKRGGALKRWQQLNGEAEEVPDSAASDPLASLLAQEEFRLLQQALECLPRNQRIAFTLSKYDGIGYAEIAAVLDTTVPAVESLVHRAKMHLQKKLSRYYNRQDKKQKKTQG